MNKKIEKIGITRDAQGVKRLFLPSIADITNKLNEIIDVINKE